MVIVKSACCCFFK